MDKFHDHFSSLAARYANFRPSYPPELFEFLARIAPRRELAWDCACGNGQATVALAAHFKKVIATDASAEQIKAARPLPNIEYHLATAENSGLDNSSLDLITVAQAMHWFDLERFYAEVNRVLRPDGVLAVWTYGANTTDNESIRALMTDYHYNVVGPYWPPERKYVEESYASLPFPFARLSAPGFSIRANWTLDQLIGYYSTWSGTKRYIEAHQQNPLEKVRAEIEPLWGDPNQTREIRWPISLHLGKLISSR